MKQTISVLVENQAGVLNRITGLFSRRAFNIDSLAVGAPGKAGVTQSPLGWFPEDGKGRTDC